jgi:adenylyltransferase/sulfurtransferase
MEGTMGTINRHQFWLVGVLVLSCVWLYLNQGATTGLLSPVREVSVAEARDLFDTRRPVVIDVREKDAFDRGHIPGAIAVPTGELGRRMDTLGLSRTDPVLVYCGDGSTRGPDATRQLNAGGYVGAVNLKGGYSGWQSAGQPVAR